MDDLWDTRSVSSAWDTFNKTWIEEGGPDPADWDLNLEEQLAPRSPGIAKQMLTNYAELRSPFLNSIKLIASEQPFVVPLDDNDPTLFYVGKKDKVFEDSRGRICVGEHKTTSMYAIRGGFKSTWIDSFSPNSQVDGYDLSNRIEHGQRAGLVYIDGALVHKKVHDKFILIPIQKSADMVQSFQIETQWWVHFMEESKARAKDEVAEGRPPYSMPKRTDNCLSFFKRCPFYDICRFVQNPTELPDPPEGFVKQKWDPLDLFGANDDDD